MERQNARAKEHSPGHLRNTAEMGLPGRELGMGDPGELQSCPAVWMLQREGNKDKVRKELMREAHLKAFNFSRVRLPRMWVFAHLTWLVWVFMKCLLEPQKPNSRLTQICCHSHITALRVTNAVCTRPHPCGFSTQNSLAFHCPKEKDRSRWMLGTTTQQPLPLYPLAHT